MDSPEDAAGQSSALEGTTMAERAYPLGHSEEETQRLIWQAQRLDLPLQRLFEDAGISPGMQVLELGSGAGDVALIAAQFVGGAGSVVGVDKNPLILETARERARAAGYTNVTFIVEDIEQGLSLDGEFDAVVGRLVLMYMADPVATLRSVLRYLRPGGVVAFQEFDAVVPSPQELAFPPSPLLARLVEWRNQGHAKMGTEVHMGFKLHTTFLDAGLPEPQMRAHASFFSGSQPGLLPGIAVLRSMRSALIEHGIATEDELDLDTIDEQLRAELTAERMVAIGPLFVDAWARKP